MRRGARPGGVPKVKIGPHGTVKMKVAGVHGVPAGATAVASSAAVANFAIAKVGGGCIEVYNDAGSVNLLADVQGYYAPD